MAKRKPTSDTTTTSRKRARGSPVSSPVQRPDQSESDSSDDENSQREFKVKTILKESKHRYLIAWEDDEITGEKFAPTWEPKEFANQLAIDDWEAQRGRNAASRLETSRGRLRQLSLQAPSPHPLTTPEQRRQRLRRVIDSSPSTQQPPTQPPLDINGAGDSPLFVADSPSLEISETQAAAPESSESVRNTRRLSAVEVPEPPSSFLAGAYEQIAPAGSIDEASSQVEDQGPEIHAIGASIAQTASASAILPKQKPNSDSDSSRVVPDSQSLAELSTTLFKHPSTEQGVVVGSISTEQREQDLSQDGSTRSRAIEVSIESQLPAGAVEEPQTERFNHQPSSSVRQLPEPSTTPNAFPPDHAHLAPLKSVHLDLESAHDLAGVQHLATSGHTAVSSSFPFQTQLPPPSSEHTLLAASRDPDVRQSIELIHSDLDWARDSLSQFLTQPLEIVTSSSVPQVPSQTLDLDHLGTLSSTRPRTPPLRIDFSRDPASMESSASASKGAISSQLRAMRAANKAKREAEILAASAAEQPSTSAAPESGAPSAIPSRLSDEQPAALATSPLLLHLQEQGARSPSAIPADEVLPIITQEEMNTSERLETLLPRANGDDDIRNGYSTGAPTPKQLRRSNDPENANVHAVPIILIGHQRDDYPTTVDWHRDFIQHFLEATAPTDSMYDEAKNFVERMRQIALHPDLTNRETATPAHDELQAQVTWDVECSAKFKFLKRVFEALREHNLHIAILAPPGRIMEILSTFLRGIRVSQRHPSPSDKWGSLEAQGSLRVSLLANTDETDIGPADLVIAMQPSADHHSAKLRQLRHYNGRWSPYLSLVVPRSVEHIEMSLSPTLSDTAKTRALVRGIWQMRYRAGKRSEGQLLVEAAADAIAEHMTADDADGRPWPLEALEPIEDLDSQTDSEIDPPADVVVNASSQIGSKRSLLAGDREMSSPPLAKRARTDAQLDDVQHMDVTHISDSLPAASQARTDGAEDALAAMEERFTKLLSAEQGRTEEYVQTVSELQFRYEDQRAKLAEVMRERDGALATAAQATTRFSEQANQTSTVRAENSALKQQLKEANARLTEHSVPERAEFEVVRLALQQAKADNEKLTRQLQSSSKDLDYVRALYQSSSISAQTLAELETELEATKVKATGEQARLRQLGFDAFTRNLREDNRKLKAQLAGLAAALRAKDEEMARLKEASRGRMGTRGSSVPRSRLGSPVKAAGGGGSRQSSPAAGELRGRGAGLLHPLRNA